MQLRTFLRVAAAPVALGLTLLGATAVSAAEPATGSRVIVGTGHLAAVGTGEARVRGTFTIVGTMNGGTLVLDGIGQATAFHVTGWTTRTRVDADTIVWRGVHGTFTITGRAIRLAIASPHVRFVAAGTGAAWLRGTGTVRVNGANVRPWPALGAWFGL